MRKNWTSIPESIKATCKSIFQEDKKQGSISLDYKIPLQLDPIDNISKDFSVHESNIRDKEIHLSFTMPGTTEAALNDSIKKYPHTKHFIVDKWRIISQAKRCNRLDKKL